MLVEVHQLSTQHNLVEVQVRSTQPSLEKDALVRQMGMSPAGPPHCSFKVKRRCILDEISDLLGQCSELK